MGKFLWTLILVLILFSVGFFYYRYNWVFAEGVKAGQLNYMMKKGYVFKTWEGKLIQSGFRGGAAGSIQSYEFEFSVADDKIANQLMSNSGKEFELHYKQYNGVLPWRGNTVYIVDSIMAMRGADGGTVIDPKPATGH